MISVESIQGAWRIEESPVGHPYGLPHTHWLIVGERVKVIRDKINDPRAFDMRIYFVPDAPQDFIGLSGAHGGQGYAEVDGDFLFISYGVNGIRPPRFASDCGLYFAFSRDRHVRLPASENRLTEPITDPVLGALQWDEASRRWIGSVRLALGETCDIAISDALRPIDMQTQFAQEVIAWLNDNHAAVASACGERVREWMVPEAEEIDEWPVEKFSKTISIGQVCVAEFETYLWASTSLPLDHSLRIWLKTDADKRFVVDDVSVEG